MSSVNPRPSFIRHWTELRNPEPGRYPESDEPLTVRAPLAKTLGLSRIAVNVDTLEPGRRTSYPHAESTEEEFFFVMEGEVDAWIDGYLHPMKAGDACAFLPGTGVCHSVINNSERPARLFVVGEASRSDNDWWYPLNPERRPAAGSHWWESAPQPALGPHDGLPDARRGSPSAPGSYAKPRPEFIRHYRELEYADTPMYPGSEERFTVGAPLTSKFGFTRVGVHHETLAPGRRTCWPHAESAEEEFFFVLDGEVDAWIDGHLHRMRAGDACAFVPGTGICHVVLNDGENPARLLVVGERSRPNSRIYYPYHPQRREQIPEHWWTDWPARPLGPHNGVPARGGA